MDTSDKVVTELLVELMQATLNALRERREHSENDSEKIGWALSHFSQAKYMLEKVGHDGA